MSIILAVDIGYSSIKIAYGARGSRPDQISTLIFPSIAAPSTRVARAVGANSDESDDIKVWYDGREYAACIRPEYTRTERALHEDYALEDTYHVLYRAALSLTGAQEISCVVTGLPVSQAQDEKRVQRLKEMMIGNIETARGRTVTVNDVVVIPQPAGAYLELLTQWDGPREMLDGNILVIDPGYFSVDWLFINSGRAQWDASGTSLSAVSKVLDEASRLLAGQSGGWVDPETIESALRDGKERIFSMGKPVPLKPALMQAGKDHARAVVRAVRKALRDQPSEPGIVVLAGGGSEIYRECVVDAFSDWTIWTGKNPAVSNVRGFWLLQNAKKGAGSNHSRTGH